MRVLLIEDNPGDAELVKEMLASVDSVAFQVEWVEALLPGLDRLARGGIDLILLDLSLPDSRGLDGLNAVRTHAPAVPVVLLTGLNSDSMALRAVQTGAQDYLVKGSLRGAALARTLQHAIVRQQTQAEASRPEAGEERATVLGFMGAKGGVGTTTIACHVARELKRLTDQRVLLMDLDLTGNAIGFLMSVTSELCIADAADDILHLDEHRWTKLTARSGDLDVMQAGRLVLPQERELKAERVRFVLRFIGNLYRWIIIDLGRLNPFSACIAQEPNRLHLVSTYDVLALNEAKYAVGELLAAGFPPAGLSLIMNQAPPMSTFTNREVEKLLGVPVQLSLSNFRDDFAESVLDGKRLADSRVFQKRVAQWAVQIAGVDKDAPGARRQPPLLRRLLGNVPVGN